VKIKEEINILIRTGSLNSALFQLYLKKTYKYKRFILYRTNIKHEAIIDF